MDKKELLEKLIEMMNMKENQDSPLDLSQELEGAKEEVVDEALGSEEEMESEDEMDESEDGTISLESLFGKEPKLEKDPEAHQCGLLNALRMPKQEAKVEVVKIKAVPKKMKR